MKTKNTLFGIIALAVIVGCAGGAKPVTSNGGMTLDQAIKEASDEIDTTLSAGTKIAMINFNSKSNGFLPMCLMN
jgi:hypothetical protein